MNFKEKSLKKINFAKIKNIVSSQVPFRYILRTNFYSYILNWNSLPVHWEQIDSILNLPESTDAWGISLRELWRERSKVGRVLSSFPRWTAEHAAAANANVTNP